MKKFNRIMSALLAVVMMLSCAVLSGAASITFTDVAGHWAWTSGQIPYLVDKGVLNGYKNDTNGTYYFKPDGEVTRAEFIKMLDETFGLTATTSIKYDDISSGDWYYTYYQKAAAQGYLINYGSKASPNAKISRQEATTLLVRYLDLPAAAATNASSVADYSEISEYFNDYILRAIDAGIINGYNENGKMYFKPSKTLTRAEALTILYRAAGCIYNNSAYSRDDSAYSENNTVTRGGITVTNVTMNGRNIITEGASDGTVTFNKCTINGTLYIRGSANVTFDNCKVENVVALGGGKISVVSGSEIENLTVEAGCDISILSNTEVDTLVVKNGSDNVNVTGNGSLRAAYIYADGFSSAMLPEEFEIGNNLSASFGGTVYSGTSDTQNSFTIDPFVTTDGSYYYINLSASAGGTLCYYYTNNATVPSISTFSSYWGSASASSSVEIKAGEAVSIKTYASSSVKDYAYVVIQLQDGARKYPAVLIDNSASASTSGFQTEPYLDSSTTVKFKTSVSGTVMWYYAEDGTALTQLQFLAGYLKQSSALKGEVTSNSLSSGT
ncbi:MAG: S-layer homology domain-containing protein, partial [Eubacteriales bacterium]